MVPGENCTECSERGNRGDIWKTVLNVQKSAEAIVPESREGPNQCKYFDTLNHEKLLNLLRRETDDERVIQLIKRFLKSGVMENGVIMTTDEGSPRGGPLSPLLANVYLNEFDHEYEKRGVPVIWYADDIVRFCKSERAPERLPESSIRYLEDKLKLKENQEKSHCQGERKEGIQVPGICIQQGQRRAFHPGSPEVSAESQEQASRTHQEEAGKECQNDHGRSETLYAGLAELACHCGYEEYDGRVERLVAEKNLHVYLETMEESENQVPKTAKTGNTREILIYDGVQQARILVYGRHHIRRKSQFKRKTRKRRIP